MNLITSTLAAKGQINKVHTLVIADKQADLMDVETGKLWNQILAIIYSKPLPTDARARLVALFASINDALYSGVGKALERSVVFNIENAVADMTEVLPLEYLNVLVAVKRAAGPIKLRVSEGRKATRSEQRKIESMILPADNAETVNRLVYSTSKGVSWRARMASQTGLATPQALADTIIAGTLAGEEPQSLTRRILPVVQNNRTSARRIARTESIRLSTESTLETYEAMGDLIIGYQIHALMDWRTRPHHAARHGTVYYRNPKPGQNSMTNMPRPPVDEDGSIAYNCRCNLTAVFRPSERVESDPSLKALFTDRAGEYIPDPKTYEQWFAQANDAERRWAVGARRLAAAREKLQPGEQLRWAGVLNPKDGSLLTDTEIRAETLANREKRLAKVDSVIQKRHELYRAVTTFGYLPPKPPKPPTAPTAQQLPPTRPTPKISSRKAKRRARRTKTRSRRARNT